MAQHIAKDLTKQQVRDMLKGQKFHSRDISQILDEI
jgi:hypothetical protein